MRQSRTCAALATLALIPLAAATATAQSGTHELHLYTLTDIHGHIEQVAGKDGAVTEAGLAAVGCYLDQARAAHPDSALTLLGDNIGASPFTSGILYDNPTVEALNLLKPIASTIGNHELDLGQDVFRARLNGESATVNGTEVSFTKVAFPYLGANVSGLGSFADGRPYLGDYAEWQSPSGVKVAYIGAIAEDVPEKLSPGTTAGMTFTDPIAKINALAKILKTDKGADVVIAMLDDDVKKNITKMDPAWVDGLMGGDTHVPYYFDAHGAQGYAISGVASGSYTDNLAAIDVTVDNATGKVVSTRARRIPAAELARCDVAASSTGSRIADVVKRALDQAKAAGSRSVAEGYPANQRWARAVVGSDGPGSNRGHESTLGDLVADAIRDRVAKTTGKNIDVGVINAGGLRADLRTSDRGTLSYADVYAVLPFSNELGYVTMTGAALTQALEQQWKTGLTTQNSRPVLKLNLSDNVRYTYDPDRPAGQRITSLSIDGTPVSATATYTVASVTFLLEGGDSFPAFAKAGAPVISPGLDRDELATYLRERSAAEVAPAVAKHSVGVSAPRELSGTQASVRLRGLAFTEGPGRAVAGDTVSVSVGGVTFSAPIDPSLAEAGLAEADYADPGAVSDKVPITTDGAGRARVSIDVPALCRAGKQGRQPLTVTTSRAGEIVPASQGLSVTVACGAGGIAAPGGDHSIARPLPLAPAPGSATGVSALSRTGSDAWVAAVALVVTVAGAAVIAARSRLRSRH